MTWQLWRQDDNGNRFLIGSYPLQEAAEAKMAEMTRCHHKQTYWITELRAVNHDEIRKCDRGEVAGTASSHQACAVCDENMPR